MNDIESGAVDLKAVGHVDIDVIIKSLYIRYPFYGIVLNDLRRVYTDRKDLWLAAGSLNRELIIQKENYAKITYEEKMAVLEHEVLHFALLHFVRFKVQIVDPELRDIANIALDCAINQLCRYKLPKGVIWLKDVREMCQDDTLKEKETAEYYFEALMKRRNQVMDWLSKNPGFKQMMDQISNGHKSSVERSMNESGAIDPFLESSMRNLLQKAKDKQDEHDRQAGTKAGDYFSKILPSYAGGFEKNMFKKMLKKLIGHTPDAEKEPVYNKPNRRNESAQYGYRHTLSNYHLYFIWDSSGSMTDGDLAKVTGVSSKILRSENITATIITCDAGVQDVKEHVQQISLKKDYEVKGRSGTDLTKALDYIEKKEQGSPCNVVVITDGYTEWRNMKGMTIGAIYTHEHTKLKPSPRYETVMD